MSLNPSEEPVPARPITPLKERNPENELYRAWKEASPEVRSDITPRLLRLLRQHASKVCWMVLHSHQPDLINEIAQDAMLELEKFQERSQFSTWFHSRALYRCREEWRKQKTRKEVSVDIDYVMDSFGTRKSEAAWMTRYVPQDTKLMVQEMWDGLSEFEQELIELKVFAEYSDLTVAEILGKSRQWVQVAWSDLRNKLREKYAKAR